MDETTSEEIKIKIAELEEVCQNQGKIINDLIEYLERVDDRFKMDHGSFLGWQERLNDLRREEQKQREINKAAGFLKQQGYIVAADASEIDAQKLRQWLNSKDNDRT